MIGKYKADEVVSFQSGVSAFRLPKGSVVEVTQVDEENRKVLIKIDENTVDWFSDRFLRFNFTKLS